MLLDNRLFDNGMIECKTFCIATERDSLVCDYSYIVKHYADKLEDIILAIANNECYVGFNDGDVDYFEIQWD